MLASSYITFIFYRKTKSDSNIGGKDYAYYEVKEANETEENEESISQML